jgi:SAM-dependent methyltransferase
MTFSALSMPFENESLSAIFMIDTFHHIPDSEAFLREASRTLMPGGIIMMIEPAASAWGKCIYRNLHHEPFEPTAGWTIPPSGPMSGANGALPWIVFERDRLKFNTLFPEFEIKSIDYHTPLRYLISGGVSFRCPVPSFLFGAVSSLEKAIHGNRFSMFMTVTVRKKQLAL